LEPEAIPAATRLRLFASNDGVEWHPISGRISLSSRRAASRMRL
jgi:hypothetical protein